MVASIPEEGAYIPPLVAPGGPSDSSTAQPNWFSRLFGHNQGSESTTLGSMMAGDSAEEIDPEGSNDSTAASGLGESFDASTQSSESGSLLNVLRARRAAQGPIGYNAPSKTVFMPGSGLSMPQASSTPTSTLPGAGLGWFGFNGTNSSTTTDASAIGSSQGWVNPLQNMMNGQSTTTPVASQGLVGRRRRSAEEEIANSTPRPCKHGAHGSGAQMLGGIMRPNGAVGSGSQMLGGIMAGNGTSDSESTDIESASGTQSPNMVLPQRLLRKRSHGRTSLVPRHPQYHAC